LSTRSTPKTREPVGISIATTSAHSSRDLALVIVGACIVISFHYIRIITILWVLVGAHSISNLPSELSHVCLVSSSRFLVLLFLLLLSLSEFLASPWLVAHSILVECAHLELRPSWPILDGSSTLPIKIHQNLLLLTTSRLASSLSSTIINKIPISHIGHALVP